MTIKTLCKIIYWNKIWYWKNNTFICWNYGNFRHWETE